MHEESSYSILVRGGKALSAQECAELAHIVAEGGALGIDCAAELGRAAAVATVALRNSIIGVAAIKAKRPSYAAKIAERSGFSFSSDTRELGYVAVRPESRGLGLSRNLVDALLDGLDEPLFATTSSDRMQRVLNAAGFVQRGKTWPGRRGALSLWLRSEPG
jgi:GNAT superfamily N-acetyltransferase